MIELLFDVTIWLARTLCFLLLGFAFGLLVVEPILSWLIRLRWQPESETETFVIDEEKGDDA